MLHGENLTLDYKDGEGVVEALHEISFRAQDHQFIGILGPSGCGKSSLLYMLSGLRKPTKGEVYLDDRPYSKMTENERVGPTPQTIGVSCGDSSTSSWPKSLTAFSSSPGDSPTARGEITSPCWREAPRRKGPMRCCSGSM